MAVVVALEVLALPERGRVRKDDEGETVREFEFDRVRRDEPARGAMYEESMSRALFVGRELSEPVACSSIGLWVGVPSIGSGAERVWDGARRPSVEGM